MSGAYPGLRFVASRFAITAVLAFIGGRGDRFASQTLCKLHDCRFYPRAVAIMRNDLDVKFEPSVEGGRCAVAGPIHKEGSIRHAFPYPAQKPLVDFHLPFVRLLPITLQRNLFFLGCRLVVDDMELTLF